MQGGTIDMIASDHSPATPALKLLDEGDFLSAWGGIAGRFDSDLESWVPGKSVDMSVVLVVSAPWHAQLAE